MAARRDSMAQSMAMVNAGDTSPFTVSKSMVGATGLGRGRPCASSGNLEPIVANSTPVNLLRNTDAAVPTISAIREPGIFLKPHLFHRMITKRQAMLNPVSVNDIWSIFWK